MSEDIEARRKHPRHELHGPVNVVDRSDGSNLGIIANISLDGMMIGGANTMIVDKLYQLQLQLPSEVNGIKTVDLGIDCLWSSGSGGRSDFFWSGCQIIDVSEEAQKMLEALIEAFAVT